MGSTTSGPPCLSALARGPAIVVADSLRTGGDFPRWPLCCCCRCRVQIQYRSTPCSISNRGDDPANLGLEGVSARVGGGGTTAGGFCLKDIWSCLFLWSCVHADICRRVRLDLTCLHRPRGLAGESCPAVVRITHWLPWALRSEELHTHSGRQIVDYAAVSALGPGTRKTRQDRITTSDGAPPFLMQRPHLVKPQRPTHNNCAPSCCD